MILSRKQGYSKNLGLSQGCKLLSTCKSVYQLQLYIKQKRPSNYPQCFLKPHNIGSEIEEKVDTHWYVFNIHISISPPFYIMLICPLELLNDAPIFKTLQPLSSSSSEEGKGWLCVHALIVNNWLSKSFGGFLIHFIFLSMLLVVK